MREAIGDTFLDDIEQTQGARRLRRRCGVPRELRRGASAPTRSGWPATCSSRMGVKLDPSALFDIQIKRIHEYKRQLLNILEAVALYDQIRSHPERDWVPRVKFFGGKAAPELPQREADHQARQRRREGDQPRSGGARPARRSCSCRTTMSAWPRSMVPAADLSEQISTAGMEASGTGNMKFALNGALTIGTLDGANVEMKEHVGDDNIVIFGLTAEEVAERRRERLRSARRHRGLAGAVAGAWTPSRPACSRPTSRAATAR